MNIKKMHEEFSSFNNQRFIILAKHDNEYKTIFYINCIHEGDEYKPNVKRGVGSNNSNNCIVSMINNGTKSNREKNTRLKYFSEMIEKSTKFRIFKRIQPGDYEMIGVYELVNKSKELDSYKLTLKKYK